MRMDEIELLPDEEEAVREAEEAKTRGEKFFTHEEVWNKEKPANVVYSIFKWWAHLESNQKPSGYEPVALTN